MHWKGLRVIGENEQRLYSLDAWRECPFYTARERAGLEWTEAVTLITDDHVPDEVYEKVQLHFSENHRPFGGQGMRYFDDSLRGGDSIRSRFLLVFDDDADLSTKEAANQLARSFEILCDTDGSGFYRRKTEFSTGNRLNMTLLCISYSDT